MATPARGPNRPPLQPRIVLVEDDQGRMDRFTDWLRDTRFLLVICRSGGQALGMFSKGGEGIAGILLDHDLSDSTITETDRLMSTSNVLPTIVRNVPREVPILIHSHNASKPPQMVKLLQSAGFSVTRIRFDSLTRDRFELWLEDVGDNWESRQDG
jgi:CheY-like chemotaxis protein